MQGNLQVRFGRGRWKPTLSVKALASYLTIPLLSKKKDVYYLMKLFGHATQRQTLQYIGVESDEIRASMEDFTL